MFGNLAVRLRRTPFGLLTEVPLAKWRQNEEFADDAGADAKQRGSVVVI